MRVRLKCLRKALSDDTLVQRSKSEPPALNSASSGEFVGDMAVQRGRWRRKR
jgi:hypothetical protein